MASQRLLISLLSLLMLVGCNKNKNNSVATLSDPVVTTLPVSTITNHSAESGGNVTDASNGTIVSRGICWSINQFPTVDDVNDGKARDVTNALGAFTVVATGLLPNKTYYLRAFATNEQGTGYGDHVVFTTSP